jgi:uncharacterized membrane protein
LYKNYVEVGFAKDFVYFNGKRVIKEVAIYLDAMIKAAAADSPSVSLVVTSGFRTMAEQERLYGVYQAGGNLAARAGGSNHQNGIAVDFNVHDAGGRYKWMVKNAWKYGFIRTCHRERWHWEYRGDWAGQEKPEWAKHPAWGANGHQPRAMFSFVAKDHICGRSSGGSSPIKDKNYWNIKQPTISRGHSDGSTEGYNNSWIGPTNEHLPDKFDEESPGWDRA